MISIIIPVFNEADNLQKLLPYLWQNITSKTAEIIVADAASTDQTKEICLSHSVKYLQSPKKGRANQMNYAAMHAIGSILYFVHADTLMPASFEEDILQAVSNGYHAGCYRYQFDSNKTMLKVNAYFTRFNFIMCRGGDQTLFVVKEVFESLNGFKDDYQIMEEYDFLIRLQKKYAFRIIPKNAIVSARKYEKNSYFKVNLANFIVFMMFFSGASQNTMVRFYRKILNYR